MNVKLVDRGKSDLKSDRLIVPAAVTLGNKGTLVVTVSVGTKWKQNEMEAERNGSRTKRKQLEA